MPAKTKFYPVKKYKRPPYDLPKGYEWFKSRKSVDVIYRRPVYYTGYEERWIAKHGRRRGHYAIVGFRVPTGGYVRKYGRTHIKHWIKQKIAKPFPVKKEKWADILGYIRASERQIKRAYPRLPMEYKAWEYRNCNYLELNTLFNTDKPELDAEKLYSMAIVYFYTKLTGYQHTKILREKMSFGHFPKPMNIFELSQYVREYLVPTIKEYQKKSTHATFVKYSYFGAMTEQEWERGKRNLAKRRYKKEIKEKWLDLKKYRRK